MSLNPQAAPFVPGKAKKGGPGGLKGALGRQEAEPATPPPPWKDDKLAASKHQVPCLEVDTPVFTLPGGKRIVPPPVDIPETPPLKAERGSGTGSKGDDFDFNDVFHTPSSPSGSSRPSLGQGSEAQTHDGPEERESEVSRQSFASSRSEFSPEKEEDGEAGEGGDAPAEPAATGPPTPSKMKRVDSIAMNIPGASMKLGPEHFQLLRVVGQGAFGKVFQVRKLDTGDIFAMKVLRKDRILEKGHIDYLRTERDVLTSVVHPFIVNLKYSFQTTSKLYLILEFINGGHLFFQLYHQGCFDEPLAKLYIAEVVLAVAHLHSLGIIHRDLKPENVLLDNEGHVKITDFGLAKGNVTDDFRTNSMCGTMEYMAPEIINGAGHAKGVDWWSVGILLFEMLTGNVPFRGKNRQQLQKKIVSEKIKLPTHLTSDAHSLLKGLLAKDQSRRLGSGPSGSKDIMTHPFFRGINWKRLEAREIVPPFTPNIAGQECVANFDTKWTDMPPTDSPCGTPPTKPGDDFQNLFNGFTYVAPGMQLMGSTVHEEDDAERQAASSSASSAGD